VYAYAQVLLCLTLLLAGNLLGASCAVAVDFRDNSEDDRQTLDEHITF
jgi:hypothetical protein